MRKQIRIVCGPLAIIAVVAAPAGASTTTTTTTGPARGAPIVGGIGLRLVDIPLGARANPLAHIYILDRLAPGTTIHRRIQISNTTTSEKRVALYAAAATVSRGRFIGDQGHTRNDLSTWTSVLPGTSNVAAGARLTAVVTISIPDHAAPGEQYAVVWAEVRSAPTAARDVTEVSRVGIRLYVSVGSGGPPASNFTIDSLNAERASSGRPTIVARVRNTGGRALDMSGSLQLSAGPGALRAGPFPATLGTTLAIGDTEPVTISLDQRIPAGPWTARVTLRSGLLQRSVQGTVTFPKTGASTAIEIPSNRRGWLVPTAAGLVALALLGVSVHLVGARLLPTRKRRTLRLGSLTRLK